MTHLPQCAGVLADKRLDLPKSSWLNFFNFVPDIEIPRSEGLRGKLGVICKENNVCFQNISLRQFKFLIFHKSQSCK